MATHRVGIFMPYFNMGEYIADSLASLRMQTFTDFIVKAVDDASTDGTSRSVLQNVSESFLETEFESENLGLVRLANKHMSQLDAEYIMLFSPDDLMEPDFLQAQVSFLDEHPDVAAVCTDIQEFGGSESIIRYNDERCGLPSMLVENRFSGAALMRKSAFLAAGMHDDATEFYPNLDYELWISMLSKGMKLRTIPRVLFRWRVVEDSLSHNVEPKQIRIFRAALLEKYSAQYQEHAMFVLNHYLNEIERFERYYLDAEVGHEWLDAQYHSLSARVRELESDRDSGTPARRRWFARR